MLASFQVNYEYVDRVRCSVAPSSLSFSFGGGSFVRSLGMAEVKLLLLLLSGQSVQRGEEEDGRGRGQR